MTSRWGGTRYLPYAFTEHGIIMLASVLNSPTAVEASVRITDTFVAMRKTLASVSERDNNEEKNWRLKWQLAILVLATLSHWQHCTTILVKSVSLFHRLISPTSRTY